MDLDIIKRLIKMVDSSGITDLAIEEGELKIRISKKIRIQGASTPQTYFNTSPVQSAPVSVESIEQKSEVSASSSNLYEIRSPIVGTFYRAPAPDSDPYIQVGESVTKGTVLCIVEAMKLMNEIESDVDGKLMKIFVENGKPVEYNQPLFLIEKF